MGSIRVAMLIQDYLPIIGGAQHQLGMVAPRLERSGIEIHILTRLYPHLQPFERMDGVPVYRLAASGSKPAASIMYTLAALRKLRSLKPDLIHAFNLFSPLTTALLYKQLSGVPVIVKVLRGGQLGDVDRLRKRAAGKLRLKYIRRHVDAFITISSEIDSELASVGIDAGRRWHIPNGVDTARFSPVEEHRKMDLRHSLDLPDGRLIVYTGRLVREKGIRPLVDIWPSLRQDFADAHLILVGSGPETQGIQDAQIRGVHLVGQVHDVPPYLQAADLFVLPSATEGLSNAMLEAMSAGLPVLATRVGGAQDAIVHQENGWLVPPNQPQQFRDAITSLLARPEYMVRLGRAARQTIEDRYALEITSRQLKEMYTTFVKRPGQIEHRVLANNDVRGDR